MSTKLSVLIPTKNEAENITDCIRSIGDLADELVVVDSYSEDDTVELAMELGADILQRQYRYSTSQKNWAMSLLKNDWVLILDADERLTPAARQEIAAIMRAGPSCDGYWIRRDTFFLGRRMRCLSSDTVLRLFNRKRGRYEDKLVHGEVQMTGKVGGLKAPMEHYSYRSFSHFIPKFDRYTTWAAQEAFLRGRRSSWWKVFSYPLGHFLKYAFLKGGILEGTRGLIVTGLDAYVAFLKYSKLWELGWRESRGLPLDLPHKDEEMKNRKADTDAQLPADEGNPGL